MFDVANNTKGICDFLKYVYGKKYGIRIAKCKKIF